MFELKASGQGLATINAQIGATEKQITVAFNRAAQSTVSWMQRLARSIITQGLKLRSGAVLKPRLVVRRSKRRGLTRLQFWIGLNDLPVEAFKGRPTITGDGVRHGSHVIEGGFFIQVGGGKRLLVRRVADGRLPIARPTIPIEDDAREIVERIYQQADDYFLKRYSQELFGLAARGYGA